METFFCVGNEGFEPPGPPDVKSGCSEPTDLLIT